MFPQSMEICRSSQDVDVLRGLVLFGEQIKELRQIGVSLVDAELEVEDGDAQHDVLDEEEGDKGGHDLERLVPAFLD